MAEPVTRYRLTTRQLLLSMLAPVVLLVVFALLSTGSVRSVLIGAAGGSAIVGLLRVRAGLDVDDDGLVVRGMLGGIRIPWGDVVGVEVSQRGSRRLLTIETAKRLYRPLAPATSKGLADPAFEAKARAVADAWRQHR